MMPQADNNPPEENLELPFYRRMGLKLLFGLVAALSALIFFGLLADLVLEGETKNFDAVVLATIHQYASPNLTLLMSVVTRLGSTSFLMLLSVLLVFWGIKRQRAAVLFGITMLGAALLIWVLKLSFHRARPEPYFEIMPPKSYSFPSGHALGAFCFYGVLAALVADRVKSRQIRLIIWAAAILMIALIGVSRLYLGVHYPSDVLAGYAAGFVWVMTVASVDRLLVRKPGAPKTN